MRASGCPPKNLSSTAENTASGHIRGTNGGKHRLVRRGGGEERHARAQLQIVRKTEHGRRVAFLEREQGAADLQQVRAQRRLAQVSARLVKPGDGIKLRCAAHAQPRGLREDVPDPVAALAAAADLAQSGGIVPALRGEKAVEIIHRKTSSEAETDKWLHCKSLLIMPFRIGIVKRAAAQIFFYNALALRYNGAVEKGAFPWS